MFKDLGGIFNSNAPIDDSNLNKSANNSFMGGGEDFTKSHSKKQTELDSIPENIPEMELHDRIDKALGKWQQGVSESKNLLLLLSTLHEVWTKEEKLKDISLKDMVNDNKLASREYRKCMLFFHDDKIKKYSEKDQYIAKSLYYILTQAHEVYRNTHKM